MAAHAMLYLSGQWTETGKSYAFCSRTQNHLDRQISHRFLTFNFLFVLQQFSQIYFRPFSLNLLYLMAHIHFAFCVQSYNITKGVALKISMNFMQKYCYNKK